MSAAGWSSLVVPDGLLDPGVKAPVPTPDASTEAYAAAVRPLLQTADIPRGTLETGVSTAASFLYGAQSIVGVANRLIADDASSKAVQELSVGLLRSFTLLLQESRPAYVLRQVAEISASRPGPPAEGVELRAWPRLKGYMTPLEATLERLGGVKRMDVPRRASLVVHLDDLYDDACLQLQRFFGLVELDLDSAISLFPEFLRRLHEDFIRGSITDHLLGGAREGDPEESTGLVALVPELVRALE